MKVNISPLSTSRFISFRTNPLRLQAPCACGPAVVKKITAACIQMQHTGALIVTAFISPVKLICTRLGQVTSTEGLLLTLTEVKSVGDFPSDGFLCH